MRCCDHDGFWLDQIDSGYISYEKQLSLAGEILQDVDLRNICNSCENSMFVFNPLSWTERWDNNVEKQFGQLYSSSINRFNEEFIHYQEAYPDSEGKFIHSSDDQGWTDTLYYEGVHQIYEPHEVFHLEEYLFRSREDFAEHFSNCKALIVDIESFRGIESAEGIYKSLYGISELDSLEYIEIYGGDRMVRDSLLPNGIKRLITNQRNVKHLVVRDWFELMDSVDVFFPNVESIYCERIFTQSSLSAIFNCHKLERLIIKEVRSSRYSAGFRYADFSNLTSKSLRLLSLPEDGFRCRLPSNFASAFPGIELLSISLNTSDIDEPDGLVILGASRLKHLALGLGLPKDSHIGIDISDNSALEYLNLKGAYRLNPKKADAFWDQISQLKQLSISVDYDSLLPGQIANVSFDEIESLEVFAPLGRTFCLSQLNLSPGLKMLNISNTSDNGVIQIDKGLPNLVSLELRSYDVRVSCLEGIKAYWIELFAYNDISIEFCRKLPFLETLTLQACRGVEIEGVTPIKLNHGGRKPIIRYGDTIQFGEQFTGPLKELSQKEKSIKCK